MAKAKEHKKDDVRDDAASHLTAFREILAELTTRQKREIILWLNQLPEK